MAVPRFTSADAVRYITRALAVLPTQARAARAGLEKLLADVKERCDELMRFERDEAKRMAASLKPNSQSHRMVLALGEGQAKIVERRMAQDYECSVCGAGVPNCIAGNVAGCPCIVGMTYRATHWPDGGHITTDTDQNVAAWVAWDAAQLVHHDKTEIPVADYLPMPTSEREVDEVARLLSRLAAPNVKLIKVDLASDGGVLIPPELRDAGFVEGITEILKAKRAEAEKEGAELRAMLRDFEAADRSITADQALGEIEKIQANAEKTKTNTEAAAEVATSLNAEADAKRDDTDTLAATEPPSQEKLDAIVEVTNQLHDDKPIDPIDIF